MGATHMGPVPDATIVIPARGGSVGIPSKNLATVGGIPLIRRAVQAALRAPSARDVVVSTDSEAIAEIAESEGADVVHRPDNLATSSATSETAVRHAIDQLRATGSTVSEFTVLVQCTSPFIDVEDIELVLATMRSRGADSCWTVSQTHNFLWRQQEDGTAAAVNHDGSLRRPRQELEPQYVETGAAYGFRTSAFLEAGTRFCGRTALAVVPASRSMEIDAPFDLTLARHWHAALAEHEERPVAAPDRLRAVVMDFDGVMTDNSALVLQSGEEAVIVNRSDGLAISRLRTETEAALLVLSTETNPVVARRCEKLQLECLTGVADKRPALVQWLDDRGISASECLYIGNDLNDLSCMTLVGFAVAPNDAAPEVCAVADLVLASGGGRGAVRELVDWLLASGCLPKPERTGTMAHTVRQVAIA